MLKKCVVKPSKKNSSRSYFFLNSGKKYLEQIKSMVSKLKKCALIFSVKNVNSYFLNFFLLNFFVNSFTVIFLLTPTSFYIVSSLQNAVMVLLQYFIVNKMSVEFTVTKMHYVPKNESLE